MILQIFRPGDHTRPQIVDWLPAASLMVMIFMLSSRSPDQLPQFGSWDQALKKAGHIAGYALLALAYRMALVGPGMRRRPPTLADAAADRSAWLLACAFAVTDELHQHFVPGRRASIVDVVAFDAAGAAGGLIACAALRRFGSRRRKAASSDG